MARNLYTGIDVGTHTVKVVIAAPKENPEAPLSIIGTGTAPSRGMRHGYVNDIKEAAKSIREAIDRASSASKIKVRSARVGLGGVGIEEVRSSSDISLTPSGGIVTEKMIERVLSDAEKKASARLVNRAVLHSIPLEYRVDGVKVYGRPQGLQGTKLSADVLLITALTQHQENLIEAVEALGIEVEGVMASPLAASLVTLTKAQKMAGVVLADIGAETVSVAIFEEDTPVSIKILPTGSAKITEAIALSFQVPLSEAESLKRGGVTGSDIPNRKLFSIVTTQLKEIYTLVNAHLKSIGRHRLLPAGVVLTGGGSGVGSSDEIAKTILKLPAQIGQIGHLPRSSGVDASSAVAYGLCRWGYAEDTAGASSTLGDVLGGTWEWIKRAIRSLLP